MNYLAILGLGIVAIASAFLAWRFFQEAQSVKARFSHIVDVEAETKQEEARLILRWQQRKQNLNRQGLSNRSLNLRTSADGTN